jgi:hypothetical protein
MTNSICYVIVIYGNRYAAMLYTLLYSISRTHAQPRAILIHQNLDASCVEALRKAYGWVTPITSSLSLPSESNRRLSSKMNAQVLAFDHVAEGDVLAFIDVDMFAQAEPNMDFLEGFDVGITVKEEQYPINSGVVFVRNNPSGRAFFSDWSKRNREVLASDELMRQAKSHVLPYGGANQMSLHQLLGFNPDQRSYRLSLNGISVGVNCIDCSVYNETRSVPLSETTCLYHLKGGWQPVLLDGHWFPVARPFADCRPIYSHYIGLYKAAKAVYLGNGGSEIGGEIYLPAWYGAKSPLSFAIGTAHHFCVGQFRRTLSRISHVARRVWSRLLPK